MKKFLFLPLFLLFATITVYSQTVIKAVRTDTPPQIDGHVNEEEWKQSYSVTDFYQREPNLGAPVSKKTEFLVCYDSHNIYFAVKCWDSPDKITAKEMARDVSLGNDDRIQIILDTYLDRRNGYWFQIGPRGSIGDALISENGAAFNKEWDGLWTGKATVKDYGWEAEIAVPFKSLGFEKSNTRWGIKYIRHIVSNIESSYWPEANLNTHRFQVSDAAILEGIENITQGIGLDISPYIIAGADTEKGSKSKLKLNGGLDLFYQITPSLKSSLTINTDFAETEVDDRQINLTRFSLHFPEKRNFFLNGANYFQFGTESDDNSPAAKRIIPFFSRRMGLDESGMPIPINYGAKITGQHKNWNIGLLHMNDERTVTGNNFSVARISHNLGKQSSIGIIGTYGNTLADSANMVAGADLKLATSKFQGNKNVSLTLFGMQSKTDNTTGNNNAWGGQLTFPNDLVNARIGHHQIGENFIAGMGFVPRSNIKETYGSFELGPRPYKWYIMQLLTGASFNSVSNLKSSKTETSEIEIKPLGIRFLSGEELTYTLAFQQDYLYSDFNIFKDFVINQGGYKWWRNKIQLKTKGARNIWGEASYGFGNFYDGKRSDAILKANWKVAVPLFLGGTFIQNVVNLPQGNFTAAIYQANANILFSPNTTLYNFMQYDNASKMAGWQSRFHWIIKPGNEIIFAWNARFFNDKGPFYMDEGTARLKIKYNIRF